MRFAAALLFIALTGPLALADDTPPAPAAAAAKPTSRVSLRVVRVMPESHEALLFDRDHNKHVIAEIGTIVGDYQVIDIADDEVTLTSHGNEIVLAAPEPSHRRHADADDAPAARPARSATSATPATPAPVDPYAPPASAAPADPYADAPIRSVEAPVDPYADAPVRVVEAPPAPAPVRVVEAPAPAPALAPTPPTVVTVPAALVSDDPALAMTRPELAAALGDFTKLTAGIRASFGPSGVRVDSVVAGSLFARAGLRAGDVITAVDGQPLHTLDDAADLYARASSVRNLTVSVQRAGKPASLHVTIK